MTNCGSCNGDSNSTRDNTTIKEQVDYLVRGDTVMWNLTFQDYLCVPIDVTGWEFYVVIRSHPPGLSAVPANAGEFYCAPPEDGPGDEVMSYTYRTVINDPENTALGKAYATVPSDETALIPAGKYFLELKRVIPGSPPDVLTFYRSPNGNFEVKEGTVLDIVNQ